MCSNETIILNAYNEGAVYVWQDGSISAQYLVSSKGTYFVEVANQCGSASDTVMVEFIDCDCFDNIVNVFTPNGDGVNDVFETRIHFPLESYQLTIFNRWGENIFQSENQNVYWDGRVHGLKSPSGTYFYVIKYTNPYSQKQIVFKGTLSLLR